MSSQLETGCTQCQFRSVSCAQATWTFSREWLELRDDPLLKTPLQCANWWSITKNLLFVSVILLLPSKVVLSQKVGADRGQRLTQEEVTPSGDEAAPTPVDAKPRFQRSRVQIDDVDSEFAVQWTQAQELLRFERSIEALDALQRIEDTHGTQVVPVGQTQIGNVQFRRYVPVHELVELEKESWVRRFPHAHAELQRRFSERIGAELDGVALDTPIAELQAIAENSRSTDWRFTAYQLLGDACLRKGDVARARRSFESALPALRIELTEIEDSDFQSASRSNSAFTPLRRGSTMSWDVAIGQWELCLNRDEIDIEIREHLNQFHDSKVIRNAPESVRLANTQELSAHLRRWVYCSVLDGDVARVRRELLVCNAALSIAGMTESDRMVFDEGIRSWMSDGGDRKSSLPYHPIYQPVWNAEPTNEGAKSSIGESSVGETTLRDREQEISEEASNVLGSEASSSAQDRDIELRPMWSQALPRLTGALDMNVAGLPRTAEKYESLLPTYPSIANGRVWVHRQFGLAGFDVATGNAWPSQSKVDFFTVPLAEEQLSPSGYPLVGVPRSMLWTNGRELYARCGPAVTAWKENPDYREDSDSAIVGVDLTRQGKMIDGFPLRLDQEEFPNSEFEGVPLVIDDRVFLVISQRNSVQVRRYIACFDRWHGMRIWISPLLTAALPEGVEFANLCSHVSLTLADGRILCSTNLGVVAALDPDSGRIEWLTNYTRFMDRLVSFPISKRFGYRDVTPPLATGGVAFIAPQDCPEIFCLDTQSGEVLWVSTVAAGNENVHILGVTQKSLVICGDRLTWLDRRTGNLLHQYPTIGARAFENELSQPRGLGRGCLYREKIYWPVANRILVFEAEPTGRRWSERIEPAQILSLGQVANAGGNVICYQDMLVLATASRLLVYPMGLARDSNPSTGPKRAGQ